MTREGDAPVGIAGVHVEPADAPISTADYSRLSGIPEHLVREKLGFRNLVRFGEEGPHRPLQRACTNALGGLDPGKVDVLITLLGPPHAEQEIYGYGNLLAERLGLDHATVLDASDACTSTCLALQTAKDLLLSEPEVKNVLIAGWLMVLDAIDWANPSTTWISNISDGAGACLVTRGHDLDNVLLETAQHPDPSFVDYTVFTPLDPRYPDPVTYKQRFRAFVPRRFDVPDKEGMKKALDPVAVPSFIKPIHESLRLSGFGPHDVDLLGANHMKPSLWKALLNELKLDPAKQIYLEQNGHMAFLDQLVYLQRIRQERRLPQGGVVVLASPGIGFLWAATTVAFKGPRLGGRFA